VQAVDTPQLQHPTAPQQTPTPFQRRRRRVEKLDESSSDEEDDNNSDPLPMLASRLRALYCEHPCCLNSSSCQCQTGSVKLNELKSRMAQHQLSFQQVRAHMQRVVDTEWCEHFLLGNGGQGSSRQDILTTLKLLGKSGGLRPTYTSDQQFYDWLDANLLSPADGWREQEVTVGDLGMIARPLV
jgi:hypothetical protein